MPIYTLINDLYALLCMSPNSRDFLLTSFYINLIYVMDDEFTVNLSIHILCLYDNLSRFNL